MQQSTINLSTFHINKYYLFKGVEKVMKKLLVTLGLGSVLITGIITSTVISKTFSDSVQQIAGAEKEPSILSIKVPTSA